SGTSALGGALERLGLNVGKTVMPAEANNPKGYFENLALTNLHDSFLGESSCPWYDPKPLKPRRFRGEVASRYRKELLAMLEEEFGETRPLVKDPRLCRLIPLWRPLLKEFFPKAVFILPVRHPVEVASSLQKRDQMALDQGLKLWTVHVVEGERHTREFARAFTTYDALIASPKETLARLTQALNLPRPQSTELVDATLRHHKDLSWPENAPDSEWILPIYETLVSDAPDKSQTLDQLRKGYYRKMGWTGPKWW